MKSHEEAAIRFEACYQQLLLLLTLNKEHRINNSEVLDNRVNHVKGLAGGFFDDYSSYIDFLAENGQDGCPPDNIRELVNTIDHVLIKIAEQIEEAHDSCCSRCKTRKWSISEKIDNTTYVN